MFFDFRTLLHHHFFFSAILTLDMQEEFLKEEEKEFKRFYQVSSFWVERKDLLKKIGLGIFIVVDAILVLFVLWTFIDTYLISYSKERLNVSELVVYGINDLHKYSQSQIADQLKIGSSGVISLGEGRYDMYGSIENPNSKWSANVTYQFVSSEGATDSVTVTVLPLEKKSVALFGLEYTSPPRSVSIEVLSVEWKRVDVHTYGFYKDYAAERLDFEISDISFGSRIEIGTEEAQNIGRVSFTVTNHSAFSYYDPAFFIKLLRGNTIVGVNRTTLSAIDSGETIKVDVNWFGQVPDASKVEVVPDINILDPAIFKPLEAKVPLDLRDFE